MKKEIWMLSTPNLKLHFFSLQLNFATKKH